MDVLPAHLNRDSFRDSFKGLVALEIILDLPFGFPINNIIFLGTHDLGKRWVYNTQKKYLAGMKRWWWGWWSNSCHNNHLHRIDYIGRVYVHKSAKYIHICIYTCVYIYIYIEDHSWSSFCFSNKQHYLSICIYVHKQSITSTYISTLCIGRPGCQRIVHATSVNDYNIVGAHRALLRCPLAKYPDDNKQDRPSLEEGHFGLERMHKIRHGSKPLTLSKI